MLSLTACGGGSRSASGTEASPDAEESSGGEREEAFSLFPMTQDGFVGDTMPYFEDGTMNIYYLLDQRDGKTGYHPWALLRTRDYCTYENAGIVLPYGESAF
jgi:beta-fructofuranosidase